MLNSSLLKILGSLTTDELKDFREFVSSSYYNKNENVVKLFNYIKKFYPEFKDKKLEKEIVYKRFFPGKEYNDGFMRTLVFNLNNLAEEYLTLISISRNKVKKGLYLISELNERKIDKIFLKQFKEIESLNDSCSVMNPDYFLNKYNLTFQRETFKIWNKSDKNQDIKQLEKQFINSYENLTYFYLMSILKEYRFLIYQTNFASHEFDTELLEHILKFLSNSENKYINNPLINVHLNEILLQKEKSIKHYKVLKNILKNNYEGLSYGERFSLQNILQVFCIQKVFSGDLSFRNERFELFKIVIEQKLYSPVSEDRMEETLFGNAVNVGISLRKFEWVENFIRTFREKLNLVNRDTIGNYALARLEFAKGNFNEVLNILNSIENVKHVHFKLPIRTLTLMALYELNSMSQVFYQIDSYRHYITKNKNSITGERSERIGNFIKFYTKLAKLTESKKENEISDLNHDVINNPNTLEREWLLSKIERLSILKK